MLDALKRLIRNTNKLDENKLVHQALDNSLIQNDILNLNKEDQLYEQGITSDGKFLGDYSTFTFEYKTTIAATLGNDTRSDHITLKDTGAFYNSFKFVNGKDSFSIEADTIKDGEDLIERDGKILGLTDENKLVVQKWIKEPVKDMALQQMLKKS